RVQKLDFFGEDHARAALIPVDEHQEPPEIFRYVPDPPLRHRLNAASRAVDPLAATASLSGERNAGHFVRPPSSYSCALQTPCPGFGLRFWRKTQAFDELAEYLSCADGDEKVVSGTKSGTGCLGTCASELLLVCVLIR